MSTSIIFDYDAISKQLDESGLDDMGKTLRKQQKEASAIDRDLPKIVGADWGDTDSAPIDPYTQVAKQMRDDMLQRGYMGGGGGSRPYHMPKQEPTYRGVPLRSMSAQELEDAWNHLRSLGDNDAADRILHHVKRRNRV